MSDSVLNFDLKNLKFPSWLKPGKPKRSGSALRVKYPAVAIDIGASDFVVARLAKEKEKKRWSLSEFEVVTMPPDLVDTDVFHFKIRDSKRFQSLVASAINKNGMKTERISLILPDRLARVSLLSFEELPRTRKEILGLVKWKMKKAVPFKVDDAAVDYEVIPSADEGVVVLAILMPQEIVVEHESIFTAQGILPGLIDLSTFSLVHLYRSIIEEEVPADGDFMVLNATGTFLTAMIFRKGIPIFYRCKTFSFGGAHDAETTYRLIHREIQASLLYYQERLEGKQLARVYMALIEHDPARVARLFAEAPVALPPELIDVRRVVDVDGRIDAVEPHRRQVILQRLAPVVGAALGRSGRGLVS